MLTNTGEKGKIDIRIGKMLYNKFSDYLLKTYNEKVYKIPVNIPVTCPNRDGLLGTGGCIFCGDEGAGFENLASVLSVKEQMSKNIEYIGKKYNVRKYIAYFQNYSNTYLPVNEFAKYLEEAVIPDVVALYISTRPDCLNDGYYEVMQEIKEKYRVDIVVETGIQTVNYHTLKILNRGHGLAEFIDSVLRAKKYGIQTCAHMIIDLPMDDIDDIVEGAKILSSVGINQVKCHSLYILKNTKLGDLYIAGKIKPVTMDEYIERIITFLEYLSPEVVIQRLIGRAPEERCLFCNWDKSWWKVVDIIEEKMKKENRYQGKKFNYLNGTICLK